MPLTPQNIDFYRRPDRMKPTGFHCGFIRQWRKNGVENLTDLQGKKATTTQVIIRDFLLAKEWN
jgi:hypothetical protein